MKRAGPAGSRASGAPAKAAKTVVQRTSTPKVCNTRKAASPSTDSPPGSTGKATLGGTSAPQALSCRIQVCKKTWQPGQPWGAWAEVVHPSGRTELIPTGDRCAGCHPVWLSHEMRGTWEHIAAEVNSSDAKSKAWEQSKVHAENPDGVKPFFPGHVDVERRSGCMIQVKYRGLTPANFVEHFKQSVEETNIKLSMLIDTKGNQYHGVCVVDDGSIPKGLGIVCKWYYDTSVLCGESKMTPFTQEDPMVRTMRLASWEPADIHARIKAPKDGATVPDELPEDGANAAEEIREISDGRSLHGAGAPMSPKKRIRGKSMAESVRTTIEASKDPSSPTTQKINSIVLEDLIGGVNRSQKLRRSKESFGSMKVAATTMNEPEKEHTLEKARRMESAYDVFSTAVAFSTASNIVTWDDRTYKASIDTITSYGVAFTLDQEKMMCLRAANMATTGLTVSSAFDKWSQAYGVIKPDGPVDAVEFDPFAPLVSTVAASAKDLVKFSEELLMSHFIGPVVEGITFENTDATCEWLGAMASLVIATDADADEESQAFAIEVGVAMRGMLHLLRPTDIDNFDDYKELDAAALNKDSRRVSGTHQEAMGEMRDFVDELASLTEHGQRGLIINAAKRLAGWRDRARAQSVSVATKPMAEVVDAHAAELMASPFLEDADPMRALAAAKEGAQWLADVLQTAQLTERKAAWADAVSRCKNLEPHLSSKLSVGSLAEDLKERGGASAMIDPAVRARLLELLTTAVATSSDEVLSSLGISSERIVKEAINYLFKNTDMTKLFGDNLALLNKLMQCVPCERKQLHVRAMRLVEEIHSLNHLADQAPDQTDSSSRQLESLATVFTSWNRISSLIEDIHKFQDDYCMDGPSEFAQRAANVVKDGVSDHMEELKKAATAALKTPYAETLNAKPISEVAGGAKDSQIWSAALKDNATFDQIKKAVSTTLVTINTAAFSSAVAKLERHAEE
ncbi:unnamed protein product, partial [Prorocentrum cordatum]